MADIVNVISKATNSFLNINTITVDNWTFKLFYKWTVTLLVACSVLVASKQFFGGPITCDAGMERTTVNEDVLKSYCWMYSTFKIPPTYKGPCSSSELDPNDLESPIYNSYYQWVSIYLFGIAILFYAPRVLWILMEGGLMKHFCKGTSTKLVEEYDEKIDKMLKYFSKNVHSRFRVYFWGFVLCQFLNLVVVISVFFLTHIFLHRRFLGYGFNVWYYYQLPSEEQGRTNPMCYTFPRIASCEYHRYGSGGGQERISALCILGLNIVNDKVFLVLWWWFVALIFFAVVEMVFNVVQIYSTKCRFFLIRIRMYRYFKRNANTTAVQEFIHECGYGDWFVLYQMSKNLNQPFFMEFLVRLSSQASAHPVRSLAGLDDVDFGGGSVLDLMLQPNLGPEEDKKNGDEDKDNDDD